MFCKIIILNIFILCKITTNSCVDSINNQYSNEIPIPINTVEKLIDSGHEPRKISIGKKQDPFIEMLLEESAKEGISEMKTIFDILEPDIVEKQQVLEKNHPAVLLHSFDNPTLENQNTYKAAFATLSATIQFRKRFRENYELGRQSDIIDAISFKQTSLEGLCQPRDQPVCLPASNRYRTHDGTCNNKKRLRWGSSQSPFNRYLSPQYGDGVDSIRSAVEGGPLSSARFISLLVHGGKNTESQITLMLAQWGQLIDHDVTSTARPKSINGSVPRCCGPNDFHPSCFPIKVPLDDPWLAPLNIRCLEFLRSAPAKRRDCILSWREQTNQATSFIDASPIYSSNARASDIARVFKKGLLVYGHGNPLEDMCLRGGFAHHCIKSGDGRSGEQPGLLALHHIWVGEHNRIATDLSSLNTHWSDEKVYQETRRIIGALFQHITYKEFLPIILGEEVTKLFDLQLHDAGYYRGYDDKINPTIANSFSAAAFRFGHSLVKGSYIRCDRDHNFIHNNVSLHEEFVHGDIGTPGSLYRLIRGLSVQRALKRDEFITPELTNHLFQTEGFPFGLDLAAINIQRGRDHGIPPYTSWREPCGLSSIDNWDDMIKIVGSESSKRMQFAYKNVRDIDLFVGGIAERPVIGGIVGPTFACIIAQQFSNLRKGDRFWYENSNLENSFTPDQLKSIRNVLFSQIICRAINGGTLQPYIFLPHELPGNERTLCGVQPLSPIDLRPWKDDFLQSKENASPSSFQNKINNKIDLRNIKQFNTTETNKTSFHKTKRNVENQMEVRKSKEIYDINVNVKTSTNDYATNRQTIHSPTPFNIKPHTQIPFHNKNYKNTKPPTIIYIDEHDDNTKTSGFFHNIFNSINPSRTSTTVTPNKLDLSQHTDIHIPHSVHQTQHNNNIFSFTNKPSETAVYIESSTQGYHGNYNRDTPLGSQNTFNYFFFENSKTTRIPSNSHYPNSYNIYNPNYFGRSDIATNKEQTTNNDYIDDYVENDFLRKIYTGENEYELKENKMNKSANDDYVLHILNISKPDKNYQIHEEKNENLDLNYDYDFEISGLISDTEGRQSANLEDKTIETNQMHLPPIITMINMESDDKTDKEIPKPIQMKYN